MPCSSASRPCPERWSACVWVSTTRTISTPRFAASASTRSTAYGGSTIAATPASSSPTRYDAHPRSSSRNCWKSTGLTLPAAPAARERGARRRRGRARSSRLQRLRARGTSPRPPAPAARRRCFRPPRPTRRRRRARAGPAAALPAGRRGSRAGGRSSASRRRRLPAALLARTVDALTLHLEPVRRGPGAQLRELDAQLRDLAELDETGLHVDVRRRPVPLTAGPTASIPLCSRKCGVKESVSQVSDWYTGQRTTRGVLNAPLHRMHINGRTTQMRIKSLWAVARAARLELRAGRRRLRR